MPAKKPYKVDIDVIPYLSIMAIVLKLICLILIVMVMRIAINPEALKICRYAQLYQPPEEASSAQGVVVTNANGSVTTNAGESQISHAPVYFDCHPDRVEIQPENVIIPVSELREQGGDFELTMADIIAHSAKKFAVIITRPKSAPVYRFIRRQVMKSNLKVGYDVLESDVIIAWTGEVSRLNLKLDQLNATRQAKIYGVPLADMTNWIGQAQFEKTNLTAIIERVKAGKTFNEGHVNVPYKKPPEKDK